MVGFLKCLKLDALFEHFNEFALVTCFVFRYKLESFLTTSILYQFNSENFLKIWAILGLFFFIFVFSTNS